RIFSRWAASDREYNSTAARSVSLASRSIGIRYLPMSSIATGVSAIGFNFLLRASMRARNASSSIAISFQKEELQCQFEKRKQNGLVACAMAPAKSNSEAARSRGITHSDRDSRMPRERIRRSFSARHTPDVFRWRWPLALG